MTIARKHSTAQDAWKTMLEDVLQNGAIVPPVTDPLSVASQFGRSLRQSRELLAQTVMIQQPRNRLLLASSRGFRIEYAIANVLQTLSGSDEVQSLLFYNPDGLKFSDDGHTVRSAVGPRVFGKVDGEQSQIEVAINRLSADRSSRRAYLPIFFPSDATAKTRDVSCTGSLHLLVRDDRLTAIAQMRSQSVLMVMPYDLFLLTMVHEVASVRLGIELGEYIHVCNSAHVYDNEIALARTVLSDDDEPPQAMPSLTSDDLAELPMVLETERECRAVMSSHADANCGPILEPLSEYWKHLIGTMCAGWKLRQGVSYDRAGIESLPSPYRECLVGSSAK